MIITEKVPLQKSSRLLWIIAIGVFIVSVASVIWAVMAHGVNVPYYDQWDRSWGEVIVSALNGEVTIATFTEQYYQNEHRIVFTHAVTLLSAILTQWDMRFEMAINVLLCVLNAIVLTAIFRKYNPRATAWGLIIASLLTISINQYGNLLWGFQTCWYFVVLFALLTFYCLDTSNMTYKRLGFAIFFAFCATFSLASGLFVWFVGIVGMWVAGIRQRRYYIVWIVATVIALALFFSNYVLLSRGFSLAWMIRYVPIYLSGSFIPRDVFNYTLLYPFAITGLAFWRISRNSYYLWRQGHKRSLSIWIMIAGLGLVTGVVAGVRRPSLGLALDTRYATLATMFWMGFFGIIITTNGFIRAKTFIQPKIRRLYWGNIGFLVFFLSLHIFTTFAFMPQVAQWGDTMRGYETCVLNYPTSGETECLADLYPTTGDDYTNLTKWILQMQERGMGPFSGE